MKNYEFINNYLNGITEIVNKINREDIDKTIEVLFDTWKKGKKVFIIGNGGSASTATHFASDLNKCTIYETKKRFKAFALVDNIPLVSALTNDDGWDNVYIEQLKNFFEPGDVVIALSVHGGKGKDKSGIWSQNLLKAIQYAKDNGGKTIGLSGFDGGVMKEICNICIVVPYNTTPHVESFHTVLHHLIAFCLAEKIRNEK